MEVRGGKGKREEKRKEGKERERSGRRGKGEGKGKRGIKLVPPLFGWKLRPCRRSRFFNSSIFAMCVVHFHFLSSTLILRQVHGCIWLLTRVHNDTPSHLLGGFVWDPYNATRFNQWSLLFIPNLRSCSNTSKQKFSNVYNKLHMCLHMYRLTVAIIVCNQLRSFYCSLLAKLQLCSSNINLVAKPHTPYRYGTPSLAWHSRKNSQQDLSPVSSVTISQVVWNPVSVRTARNSLNDVMCYVTPGKGRAGLSPSALFPVVYC